MNVTSVTQDEAGILTIFFDHEDYKIQMSSANVVDPTREVPRFDLTFVLDAAKQAFDGVPPFDQNGNAPPPADVIERITSFAQVISLTYFPLKSDENPQRKHLN